MTPAIDRIACPKNLTHGMVSKRWLHPDDRQMITKFDSDVFEIGCEVCGKYEYSDPEGNRHEHAGHKNIESK
jgi:hypothetical protein